TLAVRTPWHWPLSLIALFAMFHGHAHGSEMPELSTPWLYFAGFVTATACLHALGVAAGAMLETHPRILRSGGVAVGLTGSWLLLAALA
ncbi:MAG TPA: HupE/UreJ family protein, partial [Burkholderiales bacterium]|nr:HupE/UreJ family protein [Burkholderiales bacterium]